MAILLSLELDARLRREMVIWLTSVRADGTPQPAPVWFLWEAENFLIYSQPKARKVRNLQVNPRVALNLNTDEAGDRVAVFWGEAKLDPQAPPAKQVDAYLEKYRQGITDIGMDPDSFSQAYSLAIRVLPDKVRED
jgi:PPOX class probable F420-dependent enzyme